MRKILFTPEEDAIIIRFVKEYPTNLQEAFKKAYTQLPNRTLKTIQNRYYRALRKDPKINALTCGSKAGFTQNVKNVMRDKEGNLPDQALKHYMVIMKELLELQPKERQLIINFFSGNNNQINQ